MPRPASVTTEDFARAAQQVLARGERLTETTLRTALGTKSGVSWRVLKRLWDAWKGAQTDHGEASAATPPMPAGLDAHWTAIRDAAIRHAESRLASRLAEVEARELAVQVKEQDFEAALANERHRAAEIAAKLRWQEQALANQGALIAVVEDTLRGLEERLALRTEAAIRAALDAQAN